jgi:hypothetical protein
MSFNVNVVKNHHKNLKRKIVSKFKTNESQIRLNF